jgi:hypothetical protein
MCFTVEFFCVDFVLFVTRVSQGLLCMMTYHKIIFCLTDQNTTAFKEVAIIRHPRVGEYAFGFITSNVVLQVLNFTMIFCYINNLLLTSSIHYGQLCFLGCNFTCFMVSCFVLYNRQTKAMRNCVVFMCRQIIYILVTYFCWTLTRSSDQTYPFEKELVSYYDGYPFMLYWFLPMLISCSLELIIELLWN